MSRQYELFNPDTIDEQIENYLHTRSEEPGASSPGRRIVSDLRDTYEQEYTLEQMRHSLDNIWGRLVEQVEQDAEKEPLTMKVHREDLQPAGEIGTTASNHHHPALIQGKGPTQSAQQARGDSAHYARELSSLKTTSAPPARLHSFRRRLSLGLAVAVVLLNLFGWFVITQWAHLSSSSTESNTNLAATSTLAPASLSQLKREARKLLEDFHREVTGWGNAHRYYDAFDGKSYALDYEYDQQGIGHEADVVVQQARTAADYSGAITLLTQDMTNLRAMEAGYHDKTPWNAAHSTDKQLMQYYHLSAHRVIVVSLIEQTVRVYQNDGLVSAFLMTSGRYERPSQPGLWNVVFRISPTIFKSSAPKGSPLWFPDTRINFAMEYHSGGYFINDSWWRANYGPGTNYPHYDSAGDESVVGNGTLGNIELSESDAAWLYQRTNVGEAVIVY